MVRFGLKIELDKITIEIFKSVDCKKKHPCVSTLLIDLYTLIYMRNRCRITCVGRKGDEY